MNRYIDSDAFFNAINSLTYRGTTSYLDASIYNEAINDVADILTYFPAADVAKIKHGRWVDIPFTARWICSNCDYISEFASFKYCPDCGARMDLEEDK